MRVQRAELGLWIALAIIVVVGPPLTPVARSHEQMGANRASVLLEVQSCQRLELLAKEGVNTAVVAALDGYDLDGVRAIVALSPSTDQLFLSLIWLVAQ